MIKKKYILLLHLSLCLAVYNTGQTVSISDQNTVLNVCDATSEYSLNEPIKLADWNAELNGGDYHVIWLEMSASW